MWRCDLDKPCVKFCESKYDKASCGMQYKGKNMLKVLDEVCEPKRATKYSSCIDLCAREDIVIGAGETKVVPLGVKINLEALEAVLYVTPSAISVEERLEAFMSTHCLELKCRSSLPLKKGLIIANGVDEIDLDYPDEIGILLHNSVTGTFYDTGAEHFLGGQDKPFIEIKKGEKIAQIKLVEHKSYLMGYESEEVRDGGFGSTDKVD